MYQNFLGSCQSGPASWVPYKGLSFFIMSVSGKPLIKVTESNPRAPACTGYGCWLHGTCCRSWLLLDSLPLLRSAACQTPRIPSLGFSAVFGQVLGFLPAHSSSFLSSHHTPTAMDMLKAPKCPNYPVAHGKIGGITLPSLQVTLSRAFLNCSVLHRSINEDLGSSRFLHDNLPLFLLLSSRNPTAWHPDLKTMNGAGPGPGA